MIKLRSCSYCCIWVLEFVILLVTEFGSFDEEDSYPEFWNDLSKSGKNKQTNKQKNLRPEQFLRKSQVNIAL